MKLLLSLLAFTIAVQAADEPFLASPQHAGPPTAGHEVTNRAFTGIPSLAVMAQGRLWADWYAGITPGEDGNNYVVVSTSGDGGATWQEVLVIDPDKEGPVRAFDPELWVAPNGHLFVFWAQAAGHAATIGGVWCLETSEPEVAAPKWSAPRRLTDGVMMCKPVVLSTGEWVLPASTWRGTDQSAKMVVSADEGRTWTLRGGCNVPAEVRSFDEHSIVERRDGSLWMLVRTKYGIGESVSTDRGRTWPELTPSAIPHTGSRFFIRRLSSGHLLLVKHGGLDKPSGRDHLTAYVSADDGHTWGGGLLLEERAGAAYPDGQQGADGIIRITYDYNRTSDRQIFLATFREEDAAAGHPVSDAVRTRVVISAATGGREKTTKPAAAGVEANADGEPLLKTGPGRWVFGEGQPQPLVAGARLFTDRAYTLAECPEALAGAQFLAVPLNGAKELTCDRAGVVWLLTPAPTRNKDSQTKALLALGFKKAALPEVRLFSPQAPANFCTLYQKTCAAGERVAFGQWAVPLFLP